MGHTGPWEQHFPNPNLALLRWDGHSGWDGMGQGASLPVPTVALGPAPASAEVSRAEQTHVVHPVHSGAEEEEGVDADALDTVTGEVLSIRRLLLGLLEERES